MTSALLVCWGVFFFFFCCDNVSAAWRTSRAAAPQRYPVSLFHIVSANDGMIHISGSWLWSFVTPRKRWASCKILIWMRERRTAKFLRSLVLAEKIGHWWTHLSFLTCLAWRFSKKTPFRHAWTADNACMKAVFFFSPQKSPPRLYLRPADTRARIVTVSLFAIFAPITDHSKQNLTQATEAPTMPSWRLQQHPLASEDEPESEQTEQAWQLAPASKPLAWVSFKRSPRLINNRRQSNSKGTSAWIFQLERSPFPRQSSSLSVKSSTAPVPAFIQTHQTWTQLRKKKKQQDDASVPNLHAVHVCSIAVFARGLLGGLTKNQQTRQKEQIGERMDDLQHCSDVFFWRSR